MIDQIEFADLVNTVRGYLGYSYHPFEEFDSLCREHATLRGRIPFAHRSTIVGCARCGQTHEDLQFAKLARPNDEWSHWAICPTTGEPIMQAMVDDTEGTSTAQRLPVTAQKRVFAMIAAAALPHQDDHAGPVVPLKLLNNLEATCVHVNILPPLTPPGAIQPFGYKILKLAPMLSLGTIDELVENFRDNLVRAATAAVTGPLPYVDDAAALANAQAHGYQPGKALSISFYCLGYGLTQRWIIHAADAVRAQEAQKDQPAKEVAI